MRLPTRRSQEMLGLIRSHKKMAAKISNGVLMQINPPAQWLAHLRFNGTIGAAIGGLGMPAMLIEPRRVLREDAVILHLHGGAYVSGRLLQCRALISPLCAAAGLRTVTFSYRLAPEFPHPAQLEDALRVYDYLIAAGYTPDKIVLVGESAGGNLALELALKLREQGRGMPAALALMSPWTDLTQSGESYRELRAQDATLDAEELLRSAIAYAGGDASRLSQPDFSPVFADFHGFPPTLIHCGTQELLLSDSVLLEKAMLRDGVDAKLLQWEGMCHVFQAFGFEESRASIAQLAAFIQKTLGIAQE